jgi:hypothetical protein
MATKKQPPQYDRDLILELGRCYTRAAVDDMLKKEEEEKPDVPAEEEEEWDLDATEEDADWIKNVPKRDE